MKSAFEKLCKTSRRFHRDAAGAIILPLALALPVLFGFGMLAIDGGRYFNLQTSLQSGADALALAAAAELDGKSDSIVRANRAIDTLVSNDQRFGETTGAISRSQLAVRFLTSLPASDGESIADDHVTTDPLKAGFVEVRIQPVAFRSFFAAAANAMSGPIQTHASAVAGFDSLACNVSPLFICNPAEGSETSLFTLARDPAFKRRLIALRGTADPVGPGNYGFLRPAEGNSGANNVGDSLAVARPAGCYKKSGVELRTGFIAATANAMNVRFDMYEGSFNHAKNDPAFRPSPNVRKGFTGPACNKRLSGTPIFPRDSCYATNSCNDFPAMPGSVGGGDWDFEGYWRSTFGARAFPIDPESGTAWGNSAANRPSRYQVYRHEIAEGLMSTGSSPGTLGAPGEVGTPQCYAGDKEALKTDTVDRRIFIGAILDCQAYADQMNGAAGGRIPVTSYGKFFLTEPMDANDAGQTIRLEMIELVEPGTEAARNIIRDSVQLVR